MKKRARTFITLIAIVATTFCANAQTNWAFGAGHSNIGFAIQWNEFSFRTGEFKDFIGTIESPDSTTFVNSKINLVIKNSGIDVINSHLNKMLMSEEYLDSAKCPEISFNCEKLKKYKKNKYKAEGLITIKCKSVNTTFLVEDNGSKGKNSFMKITGTLSKKDFGITGGGDRLGDVINITAYLELEKKKK